VLSAHTTFAVAVVCLTGFLTQVISVVKDIPYISGVLCENECKSESFARDTDGRLSVWRPE
jgi:hypothetical protein